MLDAKDICALGALAGVTAYAGVPDSTLSNFTDYLISEPELSGKHFIAHNEGGAVAIACGHYMATGHPAMVYMQNSGLGNAVNPIASLASPDVYGIPLFYVVGWRGEPGVHDEPQHVFQGKKTLEMLQTLDITYTLIDKDTTFAEAEQAVRERFLPVMAQGRSAALVVKRGALAKTVTYNPESALPLSREEAVQIVLESLGQEDVAVSTTGKTSREVFEYREATGAGHARDFLTVGSMGHAASIALGIAAAWKGGKVWVLDGDGAVIMHMGALATVGSCAPKNYIHVVINNEMYESVGVMPTVSKTVDYRALAKANGYAAWFTASDAEQLRTALRQVREAEGPALLEIRTNHLSRKDLGRPTTTPKENRDAFMAFLQKDR